MTKIQTREIKFRVWDKEGDPIKMYQDPFIHPPSNLTLSQAIKELQVFGCVFMQYTGLQDSNGKDIFEGDILSLYENRNKYFIEYKWASFFLSRYIGEESTHPDSSDGYYRICLAAYNNDCEVIGNIYENPKLVSFQEDDK